MGGGTNINQLVLQILRDYDIRHVPNPGKYIDGSKDTYDGCVDFDKRIIHVKQGLKGSVSDLTTLHELVHVYVEDYLSEDWSEDQIDHEAKRWYKEFYR